MKVHHLLFLTLLLFTACSTPSSNEEAQLYDELVELHDEVMPKTMAIGSITKKMLAAVEDATEESKVEANQIKDQLSEIDEKMNTWMLEFGDAINGEESSKLEKYKKLSAEIKDLKKETDKAIDEAKKLTENLSKE